MRTTKIKKIIACLSIATGMLVINPAQSHAAWKQNSIGWWNTEGSSYSIGWRNINNIWYFFGQDGYMKTGWVKDNNNWYYMDNSGAMKTDWVWTSNDWYYFDNSGVMKTGWCYINNNWYYMNNSGAMKTGFLSLNNKTYYLNESGAMVTGDITIDGVKYTFASSGEKVNSNSVSNDTSQSGNASDNQDTSTGGNASAGGSGGNSSAGDSSTSDFLGYSDLYGKWKISSYLEDTGISTSLSQSDIDLAIGEKFTVSKNKIHHMLFSISNPKVKEQKFTDSQFINKWGVPLSNLGISGDEVNLITISAPDSNSKIKTGHIIVSKNKNVYAIVKGAVFKLTKA